MPQFFEVERTTTITRRFLVNMESSSGTSVDAEAIIRGGMAHDLKNHPQVEQILYLNSNVVRTVAESDSRDELRPE